MSCGCVGSWSPSRVSFDAFSCLCTRSSRPAQLVDAPSSLTRSCSSPRALLAGSRSSASPLGERALSGLLVCAVEGASEVQGEREPIRALAGSAAAVDAA